MSHDEKMMDDGEDDDYFAQRLDSIPPFSSITTTLQVTREVTAPPQASPRTDKQRREEGGWGEDEPNNAHLYTFGDSPNILLSSLL